MLGCLGKRENEGNVNDAFRPKPRDCSGRNGLKGRNEVWMKGTDIHKRG